ncbi:MAG TPA: hypothetical protein VNN21_05705 [Dehalococcoidia bacterium]|nr:hypothetical protein [Dehalococcoidia bacterium]
MELGVPRAFGADVADAFRRASAADFTRPLAFAILAAAFLAVRAPFLGYGHGTDPDAWRVAMTAHHLLETGDYFPSRLPGNPLHEFVTTLFIPGGWVATNLATAAASLVGVYVFALILRRLQVPNQALALIGFAFAPLLLINSIATMDYMWALTAILGAYYAVLLPKPALAGALLGIAVGMRLQSAVVWLPMAYLLWRRGRPQDAIPMALAAAGVTLIAYAPVLVVYGPKFLNFYDAAVSYTDVLRLLGKEALGILGGVAVLIGAVASFGRLRTLPRDVLRDPQVGFWVGVIVLYFVSFARLPHEIAYLIPVFPFGFLLMARYFTRTAMACSVAAILLAGVVDITTPADDLSLGSLRDATIGKGLVLSNAETMTNQRKFVEQVMAADVPNGSVVMTGFIFPQLAVRERHRLESRILRRDYTGISMLSDRGEAVDRERDIRYVWLVNLATFEALRSQGYSIFMVPDASTSVAALYDYRPGLLGAVYLRLDQESPSIGKGTGSTDR